MNVMGLSLVEWLAVGAVGGAIGYGATKFGGLEVAKNPTSMAIPVALVAGSYVLGYAARQARPPQGYPALEMRPS